MIVRRLQGKEGGKGFDGMDIIQLALKFNCLPTDIENLPVFWMNRIALFCNAEAEASKVTSKVKK